MPDITASVSFDTVAREWRCKWSADNDKASLESAQQLIASGTSFMSKSKSNHFQNNCQYLNDVVYFELFVKMKIVLAEVKAVPGVKAVQRVVCGGCLDFKIITSLDAENFGKWEAAKFAPEETFLAKLKAIDGITAVETQTFTLMPL